MDTSETITRVFTKYDPIIPKVIIPVTRSVEPSILTDDTPLCSPDDIFYGEEYNLKGVEQGLEGVVFVYYKRGI